MLEPGGGHVQGEASLPMPHAARCLPEPVDAQRVAQARADPVEYRGTGRSCEIRALAPVNTDVVRLSDATLPVGLGFREGPKDDWPELVTKIKAADIVLFCTPIWWGGRSSLMQRLIERLDALDEEYSATVRSVIKGKVAGIVITGSEDGALSVMSSIMMVLSWMALTLPPECAAYWVGEVGQPPSDDRNRRLKNMATMHRPRGSPKTSCTTHDY
jgi:NAD(P)H-dependent FMN reductase